MVGRLERGHRSLMTPAQLDLLASVDIATPAR
jgi:hypothetical protein